MYRFLIIMGVILYVIYKIGSLFFRAGAASQQFRNQQQRRNFDGPPPNSKKNSKVKGGEYIDYEDVK